ncbi:MAG: hypothetical protein ACOCUO_02975 [archaeon]
MTHDIDWPVAANAVLYRTDRTVENHPEIWHVEDVYYPERGTHPRVHIHDGTHTVEQWWHLDDLQACFTPAGWSTTHKPTYILTRQVGHEVYPRDRMRPEVYHA